MSRLKNMPRLAWLVIGIVLAVLVIPTAAAAKAGLKYTGIEGTSTNQADVSPAHQLLTTEADPDSLMTYQQSVSQGFECQPVTPSLPACESYVLKDIFNQIQNVQPAGTQTSYVSFQVVPSSNTTCAFSTSGFIDNIVPDASAQGEVDFPFPEGLIIPNGYQLYAEGFNNIQDQMTANGYLIPSSAGPSTPDIQRG